MYGWVNKRRRLLARLHKTVNSTVVLSAVASLNEDRLITLKAQIKFSKHIIRSNGEPSRQSDCKICLKIFYSPFSLHLPMFIRKGLISPIILVLFVANLLNNKIKTNTPLCRQPQVLSCTSLFWYCIWHPLQTVLNQSFASTSLLSPPLLWMLT